MNDDERAIRELIETWMEASRSGDIDAVLELMTDDVVFMTPGRDPFGKQEFRAASEAMRAVEVDGRAEIREIRVIGDWAWVRNNIELIVTPLNREPVRRSGYTLSSLKTCADGRWRLIRDANHIGY
ncbi:MAG TPA: SgcJ/EcaC family oxidoreductase [Sphingomicrobium sp.]